jgi:CheY-like chemotaxis protein
MSQGVLLVDDNDSIRTQLRELLEGEGFRVDTAANGAEALGWLQAAKEMPGVILLDLTMPDMNGSQFLALRRMDPRLQGIPVVVLSGSLQQWTEKLSGADHVLAKPVDPDSLAELVMRYCGVPASQAHPERQD